MRLTVIVDDSMGNGVHGLSIYVEHDDRYMLFGTGPSPRILEDAAERLDIDLDMNDFAVISHEHIAHSGGVYALPVYTRVYLPSGYPDSLVRKYREHGLIPAIVKDYIEPLTGIWITRPFYGPPSEIALVIRHEKGLVVFTGCGHMGVQALIRDIVSRIGGPVYAVIGGLHLSGAPEPVVRRYIDLFADMVDIIAPLHCSGAAGDYIKKRYPDKYIGLAAGETIEI